MNLGLVTLTAQESLGTTLLPYRYQSPIFIQFFLKTGSRCIGQDDVEFSVQPRLVTSSRSSRLGLLSARIAGAYHHT